MNDVSERLVKKFRINRANQQRFATVVCVLSIFVVIGVVWKLHGVGISMTSDVECGKEEHQHTEECYENDLINCGKEEHFHTPDCFASEETPEETTADPKIPQIDEVTGEDVVTEPVESEESEVTEESEDLIVDETESSDEQEIVEEIIEEVEVVQELPRYNASITPVEDYSKVFIAKPNENETNPDSAYYGFHPDDIYVATAIDVRYKNNIREYLPEANADNGAEGRPNNGEYFLNSDGWSQYMLYSNQTITLVAYTKNDSQTFSVTRGSNVLTDSNITTVDKGTVNIGGETYHVKTTTITTKDISGNIAIQFGDDVNHTFLAYVRGADKDANQWGLNHSDIEISDGGVYYARTTQNINSAGYKVVTVTKYTSFVSKVNWCEVEGYEIGGYATNTKKTVRFEEDAYTKKDDKATQYELTSQPTGQNGGAKYGFSNQKVDAVTFNIDMELYPQSIEVYRYMNDQRVDKNGNPISDNAAPEIIDVDSQVDRLTIKNYEITLDGQSVIDANNKCPNHGGLDFNIASVSKEINIEPPAEKTFIATKIFNYNGEDVINSNPQTFQLFDNNNNLVQEVKTNNGKITFDTQYFATPGTYHYHIKEKIPADAKQIAENKFFKDGVMYDSRVIDAVVDVDLVPGIKEIFLASGTTYNGAKLEPTVTYSIDGEEINENSLIFENTKKDYKEIDINVSKVWNDDYATHNPIHFRIIQEVNGDETYYFDEDGNSQFELSEGNWSKSFNHLIAQYGEDIYTYRVVEDRIDGYKTSYPDPVKNGDVWEYKIINTPKDKLEINVQKKWVDDEGRELGTNEIPVDSVSVTLKRQYKDYLTNMSIRILPEGNSTSEEEQQFTQTVYLGGTLKFQMERIEGDADPVKVIYTENCTATVSNGIVNVSNIGPNPIVVLSYRRYTADNFVFYQTQGADFNSWQAGGAGNEIGRPWQSSYTAGNNDSGSVRIQRRTSPGTQAYTTIDTNIFNKGKVYTVLGYVCARNQVTLNNVGNDLAPHEIPVNFYIRFNNGSNEFRIDEKYVVSESESANHALQYHKLIQTLTIPNNLTDAKITIDTWSEIISPLASNSNSTKYASDLYVDEVAIMPGSGNIDVSPDGTIRTTSVFVYKELNNTYPADYGEWQNDDGWSRTVDITKDGEWKYQFTSEDLGEISTRDYKYFIEENTHLEGYQAAITNNGVSTNTADTPIVVTNQTNSYTLPLTGGIGTDVMRFVGLVVFSTFTGLLYKTKRKRRPRKG